MAGSMAYPPMPYPPPMYWGAAAAASGAAPPLQGVGVEHGGAGTGFGLTPPLPPYNYYTAGFRPYAHHAFVSGGAVGGGGGSHTPQGSSAGHHDHHRHSGGSRGSMAAPVQELWRPKPEPAGSASRWTDGSSHSDGSEEGAAYQKRGAESNSKPRASTPEDSSGAAAGPLTGRPRKGRPREYAYTKPPKDKDLRAQMERRTVELLTAEMARQTVRPEAAAAAAIAAPSSSVSITGSGEVQPMVDKFEHSSEEPTAGGGREQAEEDAPPAGAGPRKARRLDRRVEGGPGATAASAMALVIDLECETPPLAPLAQQQSSSSSEPSAGDAGPEGMDDSTSAGAPSDGRSSMEVSLDTRPVAAAAADGQPVHRLGSPRDQPQKQRKPVADGRTGVGTLHSVPEAGLLDLNLAPSSRRRLQQARVPATTKVKAPGEEAAATADPT
eukprot:SM002517S09132  [mRNA]  locus=s2517:198:1750:+ [translate_table: standard]